MKLQKLSLTVRSMNKAEQRRFGQFLRSPYFNQRQDVILLYEAMLEDPALTADSAQTRVSPGQELSLQNWRLLQSYLQKLADQFLALEHWQATTGAPEIELARSYRKRGLKRHFQDATQLARQALEQPALRNSDYFIHQTELLWEEARFITPQDPEVEDYLTRLSAYSDYIWLSQKLQYLCLHTAFRTRFNTTRSLSLRAEAEEILRHSDFSEVPAISTWYYCLKMLEAPENPEYFIQFKQLLLEFGQIFHADEIRDLFLFAINYCIRKVNEGQADIFHDIMDFYKDGLQKGHLFENGALSHFTYFNIVAAALHIRDYDWTEQFIHQYRNNLERSYRDSAFSFNLARLEFARKRYDAALRQLQNSNYHDPLLSMAGKTIAMKIYYELREFEVLEAHLEALIKYIRRKPGLGYHRNNYLNLARFTQKLIRLNPKDRAEADQLRLKIEGEKMLTEREWLLKNLG